MSLVPALLEDRILFILRGADPRRLVDLATWTWEAGARCVEITLNSTDALPTIRLLSERVPPGSFLGAGTVLDTGGLVGAAQAGARFIVTPVTVPELAREAHEQGMACIMGAMTPTEILQAWRAGSDLVKVFPAGTPEHLKRMRSPLEQIPLVAVGGIDASNARAYLDAGCVAVAVGGSFYGSATKAVVKDRVRAILEQ